MNPEVAIYKRQVSEVLESKVKNQRILRYFPETDMRNGHPGLAKLAKKNGIKVETLSRGEFVLFVNRALTAAKLFAPGNIVAHLRMPPSTRLDPRTIALIPKFFNGSSINYDAALVEVMRKQFKLDV